MNIETIIKLVKASGVTAGEMTLIHFWGDDKDKEIANQFMVAVVSLGATPFLLQQSRSINRIFSLTQKILASMNSIISFFPTSMLSWMYLHINLSNWDMSFRNHRCYCIANICPGSSINL